MTREDFEQIQLIREKLPDFDRIGVFSPLKDWDDILFPKAKALRRRHWDLNKPGKSRYDLLVACNVFMYSPDPAKWFRHVFAACRYFLLVDVIRRRRSRESEYGIQGDCTRYSIAEHRARTEKTFDLGRFGDRLLGWRTYFGGANEVDDDPLHVIAIFRGDLAEPILRVDDYPTGIRPILQDLSPLNDILIQIDRTGLRYHLGIVPTLLTDEMATFLDGLSGMQPVVHGFDHMYPKYAPVLEEKNDVFNERTVGVFNEFRGQTTSEIAEKLSRARQILEDRFHRPVVAYIPPCNIGDRRTGKALRETGYQYYLSEKRIPGSRLVWFKSDFYGRSDSFPYEKPVDIATLHVTWEWDRVRKGEPDTLTPMLEHLVAQQKEEAARGAHVAAAIRN